MNKELSINDIEKAIEDHKRANDGFWGMLIIDFPENQSLNELKKIIKYFEDKFEINCNNVINKLSLTMRKK